MVLLGLWERFFEANATGMCGAHERHARPTARTPPVGGLGGATPLPPS